MKNWEVCGIICSEYYHINNNLSRCFAKIDQMLEWGVVQVEDVLIPKGRAEEALLLESGQVRTANGEMSMQAWLKSVFGWQSVDTYNFAVLKRTDIIPLE